MERQPNNQQVVWFLENYASGQLVLDPPYQRRNVWSLSYKRFFIDTVLRNFPSPSIFIDWELKPGEPTIYNVVDGKQRLSALIEFTQNEFHLGELFADEGFDAPYWKDLSDELQQRLVSYQLTVENLTSASETELREAFDRLNRNVAHLTAQELRHAQFSGDFIDRMESLAELPFWGQHKVFTSTNLRRMRDIEFISELFLLTMHGPIEGAPRVLDGYYAEYADGVPNEAVHQANFDGILRWLEKVPLPWSETRWSNLSDLYALWGALRQLQKKGKLPAASKAVAARLKKFSDTQGEILAAQKAEEKIPAKPRDRTYFENVRQGANKDTSRKARIKALAGVIGG